MNLSNVVKIVLLSFLMFIMFLGPLYVSYLEKRWFNSVFEITQFEEFSDSFQERMKRLHNEIRYSSIRLSLALNLFVGALFLFYPTPLTVIVGILLLSGFIIHHRREKKPVSGYPALLQRGMFIMMGHLLSLTNTRSHIRYFRYKCS